MSLLKKCMELDENIRKPLDIGMIWEGNYWDDQDVHDCCDIDWETCEILVRKIAKAISQHHFPIETPSETQNKGKVLIFLPKVIQLPLTILAAYRAGLVAIIMDPLKTENSKLESVILAEKPRLLVTVDAFWQGQELIEVKKNIENLPSVDSVQLLIIRHVAPNGGIPPPKKHHPARRPSYKTLLDLRNGKDLEWSTVMAGIQIDDLKEEKEYEWKDEDVVMVVGDGERTGKVELLDALESRKMGLEAKCSGITVENVWCLDGPWNKDMLVDFLVPWYMGKTMTLFEGPLDYPDSSRLTHIIAKHSVNLLIGSSENYRIPNPEYLKFFPIPSLKILDFPNNSQFSSLL